MFRKRSCIEPDSNGFSHISGFFYNHLRLPLVPDITRIDPDFIGPIIHSLQGKAIIKMDICNHRDGGMGCNISEVFSVHGGDIAETNEIAAHKRKVVYFSNNNLRVYIRNLIIIHCLDFYRFISTDNCIPDNCL